LRGLTGAPKFFGAPPTAAMRRPSLSEQCHKYINRHFKKTKITRGFKIEILHARNITYMKQLLHSGHTTNFKISDGPSDLLFRALSTQ